jgi:uncharacterized membrane protein YczE
VNERSINNWVAFLGRVPSLLIGLFLFAAGVVMNLYSGLGMNPWGVLTIGIERHIPLTFGQTSQMIGLVVLAIGWALGFAPGFGTIANMYFIGMFIDLIMVWGLLRTPTSRIDQYVMLLFSIVLIGVASYLYLRVRLGAGPRDGLMIGLITKFDRPVSTIRGVIELTVLIIGYLLGGPVGIGTVLTALLLGVSVQIAFRIGRYNRKTPHINLLELYRYLTGEGNLNLV